MVNRPRQLAVCAAALVLAAPAIAARPTHHHHARAALPETSTVVVHRGFTVDGPQYAEGGVPYLGDEEGDAPVGYWESNYGREDDAAIFAQRYGCARPIWNAKSNRYMSPCN
jgi:hypothetical protein